MNNLDAILYINLAHRTDRNTHILNEIHKFCTDDSKIYRIEAIQKKPGALGCGLSHIKCLNFILEHENWKKVLILEDDFTFRSNNFDEINKDIETLVLHNNLMDVGLLSFNYRNFKSTDTENEKIKKVFYSQTTSSYIINRDYIPKLMGNFKEAMAHMIRNGKYPVNCIDIHWTVLQPKDNWFAIYPAIGYQYDNYSDIEERFTAYNC